MPHSRSLLRSPINKQAFYDFRMRRTLAKVVKIRRDRASLPIAAYQDTIVRAVASNPCVLVAGDTGCGKSTQVRTERASVAEELSTGYQKVVIGWAVEVAASEGVRCSCVWSWPFVRARVYSFCLWCGRATWIEIAACAVRLPEE